MKLVLIGGGSFVFAPTVLEDVIVKHRLEGKLVLVDPNREAVESMCGAGRRIAKELGVPIEIEATVDRRVALEGADFVIVSASPQGAKRWEIDYKILSEFGMSDQARECGGLGGLLNAFRSITLLLEICKDMEELCPKAILLDVTNPMPRVVTAIERFTSIRSVGFCNIAYRGPNGYTFLPALLNRKPEDLDIVTAGLNHFAWVLSVSDKHTGEDLLPALKRYIELGDWNSHTQETRRELAIMQRWLNDYGAIPAGSVDHHAEYLPFIEDVHYATTPPYHGTESERAKRVQELQEIAEGRRDWRELLRHGSWEHPVDVAVTLANRKIAKVDILNIRNDGAIAQLPTERVVEVPVVIQDGALSPTDVPPFPFKLAELLRTVSDVHELSAAAAVSGDISLARKAIKCDPAITNKDIAYLALEKMLVAHADLLPQFGFQVNCEN